MAPDPLPPQSVDAVADELYGLDPSGFVAARDQAARRLRADGQTDAAKTVKALRRPTVVAWAVNQLARSHASALDEFLAVTRQLDDAQRAALSGDPNDVRAITEQRQRMLEELVRQTGGILASAGASTAPHESDIIRTLQASSDPDLAEQLRSGRLVGALEPVSALTGLTAWFDASGGGPTTSDRTRRRAREQAVKAAEEQLDDAERGLERAEAEVQALEGELRRARRAAEQAVQRRDESRATLDDERRRGVD